MKLNEKQLEFLRTEFSLTKEDIENMTADGWKEVREKCFYIEADELMDIEEDEEAEESERCQIATTIANIKFSQLNSKSVA